MKRLLSAFFSLFAVASFSFAGDAAAFSDIGFSADGKTYIFGEYGKTDKKFQAYAEIYTVDIAKNDFVSGGVFKTKPGSATAGISGRTAWDNLLKKNKASLSKYNCSPSAPENLLYVRSQTGQVKQPLAKDSSEVIRFQDFESSTDGNEVFYRIKLVSSAKGSGKNLKSSYYIDMQREDGNGKKLASWTVGNPDIERSGVSSYQIDRIFTDRQKRSMIFVVQKTVEDDTGTSIRYMIESLKL